MRSFEKVVGNQQTVALEMERVKPRKTVNGVMPFVALVLCAVLGLALMRVYLHRHLAGTDGEGKDGRQIEFLHPKTLEKKSDQRSRLTPGSNQVFKSWSEEEQQSLWIRGRVLNELGLPLPKIKVIATLRHRFHDDIFETSPNSMPEQQTWTDYTGSYWFRHLVDGEYEVRTGAPEQYTPARKVVRAGVDSVDLVLESVREIWVYGVVEDVQGNPLRGVRVMPVNQFADESTTDAVGAYGFYMSVKRSPHSYILRYQRDGYREQFVSFSNTSVTEVEEVGLDVQLEPLDVSVAVIGLVRNSSGRPLAGETVYLFSPRSKPSYQAVSDRTGHFTIPNVEVGSNYRLWIRPKGPYRDYSERDLTVTPGGLNLEVVLEPMTAGVVWGQMFDADGNPIPRFSLWLGSMGATSHPWFPVTGDEDGSFVVDAVPAGKLLLGTRSFPQFSISGVDLPPDTEKNLNLILDWGNYKLQGRVVDDYGNPVPGPQIRLSWHHDDGRMRSQSVRKTIADANGRFVFSQLGPGEHSLWIDAQGFRSARVDTDVSAKSTEVIVRLEESWE